MSVVRHGTKKCVGIREVQAEADEYNKNGKVLKKVIYPLAFISTRFKTSWIRNLTFMDRVTKIIHKLFQI